MTVLCDFSYGQKTTNKGDVLKKGTIWEGGGGPKKAFAFIAHLRYIKLHVLNQLGCATIRNMY